MFKLNLPTIADHGHWSLGVLVGLPIWGLLTVAILAFAVYCIVVAIVDHEMGDIFGLGVLFGLVGILSAVGMFFGYYPFSAEYHQWREASGTVQTIDSRLIGENKSTSTKFVVSFTDDPAAQFGCNDTRCAGVHPGDHLTLTCKRANQWFGTDGYDCNFVSYEPATK
jgi:hypothetical protein